MALRADVSLSVGLATATVVYGIYNAALPTVADIRTGEEMDPDIDSSERLASWTAAAAVAGISLLAGDPTVFIIGGSMLVAMAWWHRHANQVNPLTGRASYGPMNAPDMHVPEADDAAIPA